MGLFDFWMSEDQKIAKQQRTLTDKNAQAEDREKAARWLAENGGPKGIVSLLTRFDTSLDNQLKDSGEKDFVYALLVGLGPALHRPLDRHLEKCRHVAHPLRLYVELRGEEAAMVRVFEVLEIERKKDDFKPEKKHDLLVWLAERRHPALVESVAPFLEDFDEGVRYAAVEAISAQGDGRDALLRVLSNPQEESNRLRIRVAGVFAQRKWSVPDGVALPQGYTSREGRVVTG
jgi:hypothetical protein